MARFPYNLIVTRSTQSKGLIAQGSASVRFYVSGTNTEKDVYSASSGGSPLTQPLLTNAEGELSVYMEAGLIRVSSTVGGTDSGGAGYRLLLVEN